MEDQNQQNPEDVVAFDVPTFLRLLEFAREDATDDEALHQATSKIIELSQDGQVLTMDDYDEIVAGNTKADTSGMNAVEDDMQEKQAVSEEMKFNTPDKLKQLLKANKLDYLYKDIEEINPNNAKQVAEGMKLVYDNWNCSPNGGVISNIVDYLNTQSQNQTVNETEQRWLKIAGIK
jgi:hypothetical protein